jgi:pectate lyase
LTSAVEGSVKGVVYVQGTLTIGEVRPKSNKTIIGPGTNATLLGVLTLGSSSSFGQVSSIIIRNHGCSGNGYCVGVGCSSQILVENSYFDNVSNP